MKVKYFLLGASIVLFLATFYFYKKYVLDFEAIPPKVLFEREAEVKEDEKELVKIFLPDKDMGKLIPVEVEIQRSESINEKSREIFKKLKEETDFIPEELKLLSVYYIYGELYLNFSTEFKELIEDESIELMLIYAFVNSLTEISGIERVKFLVDDKELDIENKFRMDQFFERDLNI